MMKWNVRLILACLIIAMAIQLYWYCIYNGNVIVYIVYQNNKKVESNMSIHINDEMIYHGLLADTGVFPYQKRIILNRLGHCKLVFWREDLNETKEEHLFVGGMKWIIIDAFSQKTQIRYHSIPPLLQ